MLKFSIYVSCNNFKDRVHGVLYAHEIDDLLFQVDYYGKSYIDVLDKAKFIISNFNDYKMMEERKAKNV